MHSCEWFELYWRQIKLNGLKTVNYPITKEMSKILFKIGDAVSLINETTKGVIIKIKGTVITFRSEDGFEYECNSNEITRIGNLDLYLKYTIHNEFLKEDNSGIRKKNVAKKSFPKRKIPPMEVDYISIN